MDEGRSGETFADFVNHPLSVAAGLDEANVFALRFYTTAGCAPLLLVGPWMRRVSPGRDHAIGQC